MARPKPMVMKGSMEMMDYKTIRQLEPIPLAQGEELHIELIEFGGTPWLLAAAPNCT